MRISNGTTDYTMIATIDTEANTNTKIVISGNTRTGNAGNIQYYSTASGGNHIFYTSATPTTRMTISSAGVNKNNDLGVSGNVGIGVAPATYKLNVAGDVNCTGAFRVNGTAVANSWSVGTPTTNIYYNLGNVGIGTTDPGTYKLNVNGNINTSGTLTTTGNMGVGTTDTATYKLNVNGTTFFNGRISHNTRYRPDDNFPCGGTNYGTQAMVNTNGNLSVSGWIQGGGGGGIYRIERYDNWVRLRDGGTGHLDFATGHLYAHTQVSANDIVSSSGITNNGGSLISYGAIYGQFYSVSMTGTDYLCIQVNTGYNTNTNEWIRVAYGSFTAFHRCYTDDELYNNETDESIDLFKNNYMGRVVIATGKIKTDFSKTKPKPEPELEPEIDSMTGLPKIKQPKPDEDEWYSEIDKDGIAIEDAIPVVSLSRQRKDKRVFGVLGTSKRSTNNKNRLIVIVLVRGQYVYLILMEILRMAISCNQATY